MTPLAVFSDDRRYRYFLSRDLGFQGEGAMMFTMLNPSTADERRDDATIRRCIRFARRWGFGKLYITNLSPLRATDPKKLLAAGLEPDDVWEQNLDHILAASGSSGLVVAAWGNQGDAGGRAGRVLAAFRDVGQEAHCLGVTKRGQPLHPLYVPASTVPVVFTSAATGFQEAARQEPPG